MKRFHPPQRRHRVWPVAGEKKPECSWFESGFLIMQERERERERETVYGVLQCSGINNHFLELRIVLLCLFAPPFSLGDRVFFFGIWEAITLLLAVAKKGGEQSGRGKPALL